MNYIAYGVLLQQLAQAKSYVGFWIQLEAVISIEEVLF